MSDSTEETTDAAGNEIGTDIVWSYRDAGWIHDRQLVGYTVEGEDGSIGTVDEASNEAADQFLVVDTGLWIFGKKRLVPAGAVVGVDHEGELIVVNLTKEQVQSAPDYDRDSWDDDARELHTGYYSAYSGGRD